MDNDDETRVPRMTEVGETQAAREERHARAVETAERFPRERGDGRPREAARGRARARRARLSRTRAARGRARNRQDGAGARDRATIEGARHARIQCTPDLQPSDATGLSVYNQRERDFEFRAGPIFANVVLVDEINRAMPKTQSALLEAMAERQVTVDGATRQLPEPFLLLATENPIEHEGTFPLPEAQLDRFFLRTSLGYPSAEDELRDRARAAARPSARPRSSRRSRSTRCARCSSAVEQVYVDGLHRALARRARPRHARAGRGRDRRLGARLARARAGRARLGAPARPRLRRPGGRGGALPAGPRSPRRLLDAVPRRAPPHRPAPRRSSASRPPASSARRVPIRRRRGRSRWSRTGTNSTDRRPDRSRSSRATACSGWRSARCTRRGAGSAPTSPGRVRTCPGTTWTRSTGQRPRASPPPAARTSSSSVSASPRRRRAWSSSATGGPAWGSTRKGCRGCGSRRRFRSRSSSSSPRPRVPAGSRLPGRGRGGAVLGAAPEPGHRRPRPGVARPRRLRGPGGRARAGAAAPRGARARAAVRVVRVRPLGLPRRAVAGGVAAGDAAALGRRPGGDPGSDLGAELPGRTRRGAPDRRRCHRTARAAAALGAGGARAARGARGARARDRRRVPSLRIEPVSIASADPEHVLDAFLRWADGRVYARGAEWRAA